MHSDASKPRILIADDRPDSLSVLVQLLKHDYHITPVKNGKSALIKAVSGPQPDLILLDILMPDIDGYEVCRQLKQNPITQEIPIIFISAVSEVMDEAKGFSVGAVDYVPKPFNPETVKARVKTHITLSRTLKELQHALKKVKTLSGLLPICSHCKKIRDDEGHWQPLELYIHKFSDADFSHGICPVCRDLHYPGLKKK